MAENLAYELEENKTYTGVVNNTGEEVTFNTGSTCDTNGTCMLNGNTICNTNSSGKKRCWYSWEAAIAGSGDYSTTHTVPNSICPKNWRLPANYTENSSKSYCAIASAYGISCSRIMSDYTAYWEKFPFSFTRNGFYGSGSLGSDGYDGTYWSSTPYSSTQAYHFNYRQPYTFAQNVSNKWYGMNIRCVYV